MDVKRQRYGVRTWAAEIEEERPHYRAKNRKSEDLKNKGKRPKK